MAYIDDPATLPNATFSSSTAQVNPPINPTLGGIVAKLADTYESITKARIYQLNPPKNPPPGSFSYSPQNDTKDRVSNPMPGTLPPNPESLLASVPTIVWLGAVGVLLALMFRGRG